MHWQYFENIETRLQNRIPYLKSRTYLKITLFQDWNQLFDWCGLTIFWEYWYPISKQDNFQNRLRLNTVDVSTTWQYFISSAFWRNSEYWITVTYGDCADNGEQDYFQIKVSNHCINFASIYAILPRFWQGLQGKNNGFTALNATWVWNRENLTKCLKAR